MGLKQELKELYKNNKDKVFVAIAVKGVDMTIGKMWDWLKSKINLRRWLIVLITSKSVGEKLEEVIRKNNDPVVIRRNVINFFCKLIDKNWVEIE